MMSFITAPSVQHSTIVPGTYDVFPLAKKPVEVSIVTGEPIRRSTVAVNAYRQEAKK